jgi:signal transduction histidine kinase
MATEGEKGLARVPTGRKPRLNAVQLAQLAEHLQQFDRKKHEQQGLGLGLVLVQKLSLQCGAEFSLKSKPGEGTQVHISFPLARMRASQPLEAAN